MINSCSIRVQIKIYKLNNNRKYYLQNELRYLFYTRYYDEVE